MATMGFKLLDHLEHTNHSHHVLLSLHPRWDKFGDGNYLCRKQILQRWAAKGATVDEGNNAWRDFLVASDVAIADHSSLALYHALLGHPSIFIPVPADECVEASTFEAVSRSSMRITDVSELSAILGSVGMPCTGNEVILDRLVEHRGCSERRHIEEIRELLR
jgi:hypothetical protein